MPVPPKSSLQDVIESQTLKVGTLYGRTTYYNGIDGPKGFEYELLSGFADYLGVKLEIFPYYSVSELQSQLERDRLDIVASGEPIFDELAPELIAGPAYQNVEHYLVFQQGGIRPQSIEELDAPLTVVAGSSHATWLQKRALSSNSLNWTTTQDMDSTELLAAVAQGHLPYTLVDSNTLAMERRKFPQLSIANALIDKADIAWLLHRSSDDALFAAMLEYFGDIQKDGSFKVLEDRYFGHVRQFDYVDTREFIKAAKSILPQYKAWFKQYAVDTDWRLLAALSYQESHWKPNARSHTGVRGLMMLTRGTAKDMKVTSRIDPQQSIRGGGQYFASLQSRIPARIKKPDRTWMALAAYNIGLGHLEDARVLTQRQGGNPDLWVDVKQHLPQLNQKKYYRRTKYGFAHGDIAVKYVENIRRYYDTLVWLDSQSTEVIPPPSS